MESLGTLLTRAREQKKWTIEDLHKQTRISKKYLEALEKESYGDIPGDIYVKGFIRNVSIRLGLDADKMVELFTRTKMSEAPAPYEELLKGGSDDKRKYLPWAITVLGAVLLIGITAVIVKMSGSVRMPGATFSDGGSGHEKNIVEDRASVQVRSGDTVFFRPLGVSATIKVLSVGNTVKTLLNEKEVVLAKGNPIMADLNRNSFPDFRMNLVDVIEDVAMIEVEKVEEAMVETTNAFATNVTVTPVERPEYKTVGDTMYLMENVDKEPLKINLVAKNFVYVRYFVDAEKPQVKSLPSGRTLDLAGTDSVQLTIGNAGSLLVRINGKSVSFGREGDVANKTIKWVKNPDNEMKYHLIVVTTK